MNLLMRRRMMITQSGGAETYLCRNYSPNGSKFIYTIDGINLADGDYIEVSAVLDWVNLSWNNQNIISIGDTSTLGTWNGNHYHCYSKLKNPYFEVSARFGNGSDSTSRYLDFPISGQTVVIQVNKNGIYVDGNYVEPKEGAVMYPQLITYLNSVSTISVGSQEGAVRFYGTYNYIKWVKMA